MNAQNHSSQDEPEFRDFSREVFAVVEAIQDSLERFPPQSMKPVPADWPETQFLLRSVAEDLMLCPSVDSVIGKLREDQGTLLVLQAMITKVSDAFVVQTIRKAHESASSPSPILPGRAFATFLLEMASGPTPVWRFDL
jgi:hypothetical protein